MFLCIVEQQALACMHHYLLTSSNRYLEILLKATVNSCAQVNICFHVSWVKYLAVETVFQRGFYQYCLPKKTSKRGQRLRGRQRRQTLSTPHRSPRWELAMEVQRSDCRKPGAGRCFSREIPTQGLWVHVCWWELKGEEKQALKKQKKTFLFSLDLEHRLSVCTECRAQAALTAGRHLRGGLVFHSRCGCPREPAP